MTERDFTSRYMALAGTLYKVAFYLLESREEAEDAIQELYLRLWKDRGRLDDVQNPKAYSIRILKNLCIDRIRSAGRISFSESLPETPLPRTQEDDLDQKQRLDKVLEAIKALPDRQREILIMRTVEGLSYEQMSERMGMSPLTLRVLLSRARNNLKSMI